MDFFDRKRVWEKSGDVNVFKHARCLLGPFKSFLGERYRASIREKLGIMDSIFG